MGAFFNGRLKPISPNGRERVFECSSQCGNLIRQTRASMNLMVRKFCLLMIFPLAVMGCSSNTMLTVHSEPEGAELTTVGTGVPLGRTPAALVFSSSDLENALQSNDCYLVRGIEAIWQSGATLSTETIELCGSAQRNFEIVLQRPAAAPDLEQDIEYAKSMRLSDIERHRLEQQRRTQFFPQQIPSKPNPPSQSSGSKSP